LNFIFIETIKKPHILPQRFRGTPFDGEFALRRVLGRLIGHLSKAKVTDLCHHPFVQQNISGRQVAVNKVFGFQIGHPIGHVSSNL
jgi:hypothetical protein